MTAGWLLYCTAVSLMLGIGALALDRAIRLFGKSTRWVWFGAAAASVLLPSLAWFAPNSGQILPIPETGALSTLEAPVEFLGMFTDLFWRIDWQLSLAWFSMSVAAALLFLVSLARMTRWRRQWDTATVHGERVFVSDDTGPAVVGMVESFIVLPKWVFEYDDDVRRLMVEHEREHVRAHDPQLLLLAVIALIVMPWNLALWWVVSRLRLAIEVDCDARVLKRTQGDVRSYGHLLLEVGRRCATTLHPTPAFAESSSKLEHRLKVMTEPPPQRRLRLAGALAFAAGIIVLTAFVTPDPNDTICFENDGWSYHTDARIK